MPDAGPPDVEDLAYAVAAMPDPSGKHYYWEIMLPGSVLGIIVGYATQVLRETQVPPPGSAPDAVRVIRENLTKLRIADRATVLAADASVRLIVVNDIPNTAAWVEHVLASVDNVLKAIGDELVFRGAVMDQDHVGPAQLLATRHVLAAEGAVVGDELEVEPG